jgi:hypothetical protein
VVAIRTAVGQLADVSNTPSARTRRPPSPRGRVEEGAGAERR